jgi:hypothetical protein
MIPPPCPSRSEPKTQNPRPRSLQPHDRKQHAFALRTRHGRPHRHAPGEMLCVAAADALPLRCAGVCVLGPSAGDKRRVARRTGDAGAGRCGRGRAHAAKRLIRFSADFLERRLELFYRRRFVHKSSSSCTGRPWSLCRKWRKSRAIDRMYSLEHASTGNSSILPSLAPSEGRGKVLTKVEP